MRRAALIALLVLAATACVWSLFSASASVLAWQAGRVGEKPSGQALPVTHNNDQTVRRLLGMAKALEPTNPANREQLAQHLERLALQAPPRGVVETGLLREAHRLYIEAAARRPTWPLGLTSVLRTDLKLGRLGSEFTRLYTRAAELGRSEPAALRALVDLGLVAWPLLEPGGRREVQELLRHGLRIDPNHVLRRAVGLRQGAVLEPLIASDADLQRRYAALRGHSVPRR